ncbi:unnamed protein product [Closterium sp. Yama58-4]|nr:unnamed protein product [Closterium sp. Yama58-4]
MAETAERGGDPWRNGQDSLNSPNVVFTVAIAQVVVRRVLAGLDGAAREEELVFDAVHAALVAHGPGQLQRLELRAVADGRVLLHAAIATSFWCQPQTDMRVHMVTPDGTRWILMFASPTESWAFLLAIGFARALATSLSAHLASAAAQTYPPHAYVPVPPTLQVSTGCARHALCSCARHIPLRTPCICGGTDRGLGFRQHKRLRARP